MFLIIFRLCFVEADRCVRTCPPSMSKRFVGDVCFGGVRPACLMLRLSGTATCFLDDGEQTCLQAEALAQKWRARSQPVLEHFESLEPVLALRYVGGEDMRYAVQCSFIRYWLLACLES